MPRPRTEIGSHGTIRYRALGRRKVQARTLVRDGDGVRREATALGTSEANARQNLLKALDERAGFGVGGALTAVSTVADAAALWLVDIEHRVAEGTLASNSRGLYVRYWKTYVEPALGQLLLREVTVARVQNFLSILRTNQSAAITKLSRTVLSGVLARAVTDGAMRHNPVHEVRTVARTTHKRPRALTQAERELWFKRMDADELACAHDIPDLTRFLLATGVRIGEALGCSYDEVELDTGIVRIEWTITRVAGVGLVRKPPKTEAGIRTLILPSWAVEMLKRRTAWLGESGPLFPTQRAGANGEKTWRDPNNTGKKLRRARDRAGFGWVTAHNFRKTVATVMEEAGMTPRQVADQLGHTRVSMTQDVYFGRAAVAAGGAALEDLWGAPGDDLSQAAPDGFDDES